jgi:hypothetical protein
VRAGLGVDLPDPGAVDIGQHAALSDVAVGADADIEEFSVGADWPARMLVIARAFPSSLLRGLAVATFEAPGPLGASVVQQSLSHVLPDGLGSGQPDGVGRLDLDDPPAAASTDPEHVVLDVG